MRPPRTCVRAHVFFFPPSTSVVVLSTCVPTIVAHERSTKSRVASTAHADDQGAHPSPVPWRILGDLTVDPRRVTLRRSRWTGGGQWFPPSTTAVNQVAMVRCSAD